MQHYCTNESLHLDITHRYKQTIIFNKKLYDILDIFCRKRYLIFQDFLGEGCTQTPLANLTKIILKSRKLLLYVNSGKQVCIYGRFSIKIAHCVPIRLQTWPPQAILLSDWSISKNILL